MRAHTEQFKLVAMTLVISILSALFIGLLVDAIYEAPQYEDFCESYNYAEPYRGKLAEQQNCEYIQIEEERQCYKDGGFPEYNYDVKGCGTYKECNFCNKEFNDATNIYNRNVFFIVAPIGLILILFGVFYGIGFIASGFMFGGIFSVAYGTIRHFSGMSKVMRVIVIFIELVIVIWLAIKKLKK